MENNHLEHHGILGMKWGVRRFQSKSGGLTPAGRKRYKQQKAALEKARRAKAEKKTAEEAKKQHEAAKNEALRKGNATEVLKYRGEVSNQELQTALNRINLERQLSDISAKEVRTGLDKVNSMMNTAVKVKDSVEKGISVYNTIAKVNNSIGGKELPVLDGGKSAREKADKAARKKREDYIKSITADETIKNFGSFTLKEIEDLNKRYDTEEKILGRYNRQNKK